MKSKKERRIHSLIKQFLLVSIITVPAFIVLFKPGYPSMHDDQHIVRLHLFHEALFQGQWYPRWVDGLGFGYGYPLFNFYPPLIYFIAEGFHLLGFSLISSVKGMILFGYFVGAYGMYRLARALTSNIAAIASIVIFTYFNYRSITVYVRGAFAEFMSMSLLPLLFYSLYRIHKNPSVQNGFLFSILLALIILAHPLIAFPTLIFIFFFYLHSLFVIRNFLKTTISYLIGGIASLGISAFFWLPSFLERKFTLTDTILLRELADYAIHFVDLKQYYYSPWGFGGSTVGLGDGISFQLGKLVIIVVLASLCLYLIHVFDAKKKSRSRHYLFFLFLLVFSLFMTLEVSKPVWDTISYLSYLQFPWRFLTFAAVFAPLIGGFAFEFLRRLIGTKFTTAAVLLFSLSFIFIHQKYAYPQKIRQVTDVDLTTEREMKWRISRSSFEFAPRGVKTTRSSPYNTTIIDIDHSGIQSETFTILKGKADVSQDIQKFHKKTFSVRAEKPSQFQLNTFNFPGWHAYLLDGTTKTELSIHDGNDLKLINVELPSGEYTVEFVFKNTPVRTIANSVTFASIIVLLSYAAYQNRSFLRKFKKI